MVKELADIVQDATGKMNRFHTDDFLGLAMEEESRSLGFDVRSVLNRSIDEFLTQRKLPCNQAGVLQLTQEDAMLLGASYHFLGNAALTSLEAYNGTNPVNPNILANEVFNSLAQVSNGESSIVLERLNYLMSSAESAQNPSLINGIFNVLPNIYSSNRWNMSNNRDPGHAHILHKFVDYLEETLREYRTPTIRDFSNYSGLSVSGGAKKPLEESYVRQVVLDGNNFGLAMSKLEENWGSLQGTNRFSNDGTSEWRVTLFFPDGEVRINGDMRKNNELREFIVHACNHAITQNGKGHPLYGTTIGTRNSLSGHYKS